MIIQIITLIAFALFVLWDARDEATKHNQGIETSRFWSVASRAGVFAVALTIVYFTGGDLLHWSAIYFGGYGFFFNLFYNRNRIPKKWIFYISPKKFPELIFWHIPHGGSLYAFFTFVVWFTGMMFVFYYPG